MLITQKSPFMSKIIIESNPSYKRDKVSSSTKDYLTVSEFFFDTIQGENLVGNPAAFLRLTGCTLDCHWCFEGGTWIDTKKGAQQIKDLKTGDILFTLDEGRLVETVVQARLSSSIQSTELICITLKTELGHEIYTTANHPFMVKDKGWTEVSAINIDDILITSRGEVGIDEINFPITQKQHWDLYGTDEPQEIFVYNLNCSPSNTYLVEGCLVHNCDTTEVWRYGNEYTFDELLDIVESSGALERFKSGQRLVLTGGSPLKQQERVIEFIKAWILRFKFKPFIEVENEAVLIPSNEFIALVDVWNNSPKLENSGMKRRAIYKPEIIQKMAKLKNSYFKFVIAAKEDWDEIVRDYIEPGLIAKRQIVVMPEGQNRVELEAHAQIAVDIAVDNNVRFCNREHIVLWDKKVGV